MNYFPNLLLYGPPGTGKTTTIMNLIKGYHSAFNINPTGLTIHLNASDDRGIDVIRTQIYHFVDSTTIFNNGLKFVVLDEVDYMTKNAQTALRYILQNYTNNVRFCLICNYVSKIDEGLQNEFVKLRFNQLPCKGVVEFLKNVSNKENLGYSDYSLSLIQTLYGSDMRSMINFMQTNQTIADNNIQVINTCVWNQLTDYFINKTDTREISSFIKTMGVDYNMDIKTIMKDYLNFIICENKIVITRSFLNSVENIIHFKLCEREIYLEYIIGLLLIQSFVVQIPVSVPPPAEK